MPKTYELLLVDNVDSLGIVGDVVKVRSGYARNFLLPRGLAETPSEEKIKELASRRAEAVKQLAELRAAREAMVDKLEGYEISKHLQKVYMYKLDDGRPQQHRRGGG